MPFLLNVSTTGHDYTFSLAAEESSQRDGGEKVGKDSCGVWLLSILNTETGQTLFEDVTEADAITVNTSGWKPGVYVAVANVGGKTVTQKIAIK